MGTPLRGTVSLDWSVTDETGREGGARLELRGILDIFLYGGMRGRGTSWGVDRGVLCGEWGLYCSMGRTGHVFYNRVSESTSTKSGE